MQVAIFVFVTHLCEVINISLTSVQKKLLCRDSLPLLSDLLATVMGHFFHTMGEFGISLHDNRITVLAIKSHIFLMFGTSENSLLHGNMLP